MAAANGRLERALRGVERQYDEFKRILIELSRPGTIDGNRIHQKR